MNPRAFFTALVIATQPPAGGAAAQSTTQPASGANALAGAGRLEREPLRVEYAPKFWFPVDVAGQDDRFRALGQDLSISIPLYQADDRKWLLTPRVGVIQSEASARLPRSRDAWDPRTRPFPADLWNLQLGTAVERRLTNGWTVGGNVVIGSASDRPFAALDDCMAIANLFIRIPAGERSAWRLYVNYNSARDFAGGAPLPGVGYEFELESAFRGTAGFPLSDWRWQALEWLRFSGMYMFPHVVRTELAAPLGGWEAFTGYDWNNEAFYLYDRRDDDDALRYYEQRVKLGLRAPRLFDGKLLVELEGGYAFQRYWFEGEDIGDRHRGALDLSDGPYARVQLRFTL